MEADADIPVVRERADEVDDGVPRRTNSWQWSRLGVLEACITGLATIASVEMGGVLGGSA